MRSILRLLLPIVLVAVCFSPVLGDTYLDNLKQGQVIHGFRVTNVYENGTGGLMGARFVSEDYGFIIDLMQIQSVPQAFYWIKTPITTSMGEPHACEHLLLGKGNRGRYVAALEDMALGTSTAYTQQYRTCYHFNTIAGEDTFYKIFQAKLDALLNPDFTDEEIRREVCHIGVAEDPQTGEIVLDEKGTVYTEMISSFEKPWYHTSGKLNEMVYGKNHPLSLISGGDPDVMRNMTAEDMWTFHKKNYHLANMGVIVSIPDDIKIDNFLKQMNTILGECQSFKEKSVLPGITGYEFPPAQGDPVGETKLVTYPSERAEDPGYIMYAWPVQPMVSYQEQFMLETFLSAFANGETSDLYNLFINSDKRKIDLGGDGVYGGEDDDMGISVYFGLTGVNNSYVTQPMLDSVKHMIVGAIKQVHDYADDSPELLEFNKRARSLLVRDKKQWENYLNSPPMFGARRGPSGAWLSLLRELEKEPGFRKSLVFKNRYAKIDSLLATGKNIWRDRIDQWQLLTVQPYALGAGPNSEMLRAAAEAKDARMVGYVENFEKKYGVTDAKLAVAKYKEEFDANTAELDALAAKQKLPGFIDNPPMTIDDQLKYETVKMAGNVPMVASTFENMTASEVGLALRLDVVPESLMVFLPFVPSVMTDIGVIEDGKAVTYDDMDERLRTEVLSLSAYFTQGYSTDRVELVLSGEGSNTEELNNALHWMDMALYSPYLSVDNLSRMRDVIDQSLSSFRNRTKGSEEDWVDVPANAYRKQHNPLFMVTDCFFTQAHLYQRLRWMLTSAGPEDQQQGLSEFLSTLKASGQGRNREELAEMLSGYEDVASAEGLIPASLNDDSRKTVAEIARALKAELGDIPDANLAADWAYLCDQTRTDLMMSPTEAIAGINEVMKLIRKTDNARMFMTSNSKDRAEALPRINAMLNKLDGKAKSVRQQYASNDRIVDRMRSREAGTGKPTYVGLVFEGTRNGVLEFSAKVADVYDTSHNAVLNCLAGKLYGGGGPHGLFMKTWAAGLAYSNGYGYGESSGRVSYYAERCPDVSETMGFVVDQLKNAEDDPSLVDYAIAQVFQRSRASSRYQTRGEAMAEDLVDGFTPDKVRAFRQKVMAMRDGEGLYDSLKVHMPMAYGPVLVGYGNTLDKSVDGTFFLIGPKTQFNNLETYVDQSEKTDKKVFELYPRDYWLVD